MKRVQVRGVPLQPRVLQELRSAGALAGQAPLPDQLSWALLVQRSLLGLGQCLVLDIQGFARHRGPYADRLKPVVVLRVSQELPKTWH